MMVPIVWIALAAFKQHVDVYQLKLLFRPTLENFALVFDSPYHLGTASCSTRPIVSFVTVAVAIPVATGAAYSFSRFRMRGERVMFVMILATQFVPGGGHRAAVLPALFRDLGILDTRIGLVLVNLSIVTPFAIWMIKGFIDGIPQRHGGGGPGGRLFAAAGHPQHRAADGGAGHRHRRHLLLHHRLERLPLRPHPHHQQGGHPDRGPRPVPGRGGRSLEPARRGGHHHHGPDVRARASSSRSTSCRG